MKKGAIVLIVLMLFSAASFAVLTGITVEWSNTVSSGFNNSMCCTAYNYVTNHFYATDTANNATNPAIHIGNNTNGALLGDLSITGLVFDTTTDGWSLFCVAATSDGVVYAGSQVGTPSVHVDLVRWASEAATNPSQHTPAPSGTVGMEFPRAMDVVGTGVDTIVGVTGSNDYKVTFLTTTDGTTFAVTDYTLVASANANEQIKQGVALVPSAPAAITKVYGTKADGSGEVVCEEKVGGVWAAKVGFTPPDNASLPQTGLGIASAIGYSAANNAVLVLGTSAPNDWISVLDGDTGAKLFDSVQSGVDVGTYGYGSIKVKDADGVAYFGSRASAGGYVCGKIALVTPTPPPTPTATPTPGAGVTSSWGLYE